MKKSINYIQQKETPPSPLSFVTLKKYRVHAKKRNLSTHRHEKINSYFARFFVARVKRLNLLSGMRYLLCAKSANVNMQKLLTRKITFSCYAVFAMGETLKRCGLRLKCSFIGIGALLTLARDCIKHR